jgi:hypothetical protein
MTDSNMLWHGGLLNHTLPPTSRLFYGEDAPYFGLMAASANKTLICARNAVLFGATVFGFPDWMTAHEFRSRVVAAEGVQLPNVFQHLRVTILDRQRFKPRTIHNQVEVGPCLPVCVCRCVLVGVPHYRCCVRVRWSISSRHWACSPASSSSTAR